MIRTHRAFDPHSIKLVIFDLDGTLIDSRLDLVHSVNAALRHIGRAELPEDVIASYVGDGAPILIQRALGTACGDRDTQMLSPGCRLSSSARPRLTCTQVSSPSGRRKSIRTSKPRCVTRSTLAWRPWSER